MNLLSVMQDNSPDNSISRAREGLNSDTVGHLLYDSSSLAGAMVMAAKFHSEGAVSTLDYLSTQPKQVSEALKVLKEMAAVLASGGDAFALEARAAQVNVKVVELTKRVEEGVSHNNIMFGKEVVGNVAAALDIQIEVMKTQKPKYTRMKAALSAVENSVGFWCELIDMRGRKPSDVLRGDLIYHGYGAQAAALSQSAGLQLLTNVIGNDEEGGPFDASKPRPMPTQ